MKYFSCITVLLVYCQLCTGGTMLKREKYIDNRLQSLIEQLKELESEGKVNEEKITQRGESKANEEAEKNVKDIDNEKVDPMSKSLELFESMIVVKNGRKSKPNDLPIDQSPFVQGLKKETVKLSPQQKAQLESETINANDDIRNRRDLKRAFTVGWFWEKGIVPYVIDKTLTSTTVIDTAIEIFNNLTCVKWLPLSESVQSLVSHKSYIKFYKGSGCWSYIGKTNGEQLLSIGQGCESVGIALHEMSHALGQHHEQSRTDRDQHVYISESKQKDGNYKKYKTRDNYPYDYQSIMQYSFSEGFEPLQPELAFLSKYGSELSFYDIADITDAYKCTAGCVDPPECTNGAFLNRNCECYCPYGLTGETCDEVINSNVCGGIVDLVPGNDVTITTPNFPSNYDVDSICIWLIRAPPTNHVKIQSDVFHLPYNTDNSRCYHWLEIRYNLVGQAGIKVCGDSSGDEWITSPWGEKNLMILIFNSRFGKLHSPELGFSLRASVASGGCIPNPCVYGICKDCGNQGYKCQCDPGFEGRNCDQVQDAETVTCTFEKGSKCFLKDVENDNFNWKIYTGSTPSDYTGPAQAYSGDNYMYAEASLPQVEGDKAVLQSDITFPAKDRCLSFSYNMHGTGMGSLAIFSESTQIWSKSGDQGFGWRWTQVDVPSSANLKIKVEATRGRDRQGDIGIDEIKLNPGKCETAVDSDCIIDSVGKYYKGKLNHTRGGLPCQRWDSNTPHSHGYHVYDGEENYCRNIRGDMSYLWCYTTTSTRWDICDVPHCDLETCSRSKNGYDYLGDKAITIKGDKCKDDTKCRATGNTPSPWCYVDNPEIKWDTCDVPKCSTPPKECKLTRKGTQYFGTVSVTESGKTCQRWDSQSPFQHNYWYLDDQENYCRNPDNSAKPWCYPNNPNATGREYCNIPACEDLGCSSNPCLFGSSCKNTDNGGHICLCKPEYTGSDCGTRIDTLEPGDCRRSAIGYDYNGLLNITIGGRTCQEWALDTPHSHTRHSLPENYCRNPDKEPSAWCYTTDKYKRYELCDVPFCTSPAKECLETEKGEDYFGTVRHTKNGIQCQRWDAQTPHSHSYGFIGDQEDFCRNPYGHVSQPWCYTTDPDKRWDQCAIPYC